jgi:hypothetical protein
MDILPRILEDLPDGEVIRVLIGLRWTMVVAEVSGARSCGLASTLFAGHAHHEQPNVPQAGQLESYSGLELAEMVLSNQPTLCSVGLAAINALLPRQPRLWVEANAEDLIAQRGEGKRVVMVGHFPFVTRLRPQVGELLVLEQNPGVDDLPASAAPDLLPTAQVIVITGMTLSNHTLEGLLSYCPADAELLLLGPSTPLSPVLFDFGVTVISGAVVTAIEPVQRIVAQGGNFRQLRPAGVRLVNIFRP